MKRSVVFLLFTFCLGAEVFSQTRFNFTTGMNVSSLSEDLMSDYGFDVFRENYITAGGSATSEVKNSVRTGFYVAAESDIFLKENLFLKAGLKYATVGDSYFFKTDDVVLQSSSGSSTDEKYKLRPRLDYFLIPVNIGVDVSETVSLYAGLTPGFNVNNILRSNRFEIDGDDVKIKWDKADNPVEARGLTTFLNFGTSFYIQDSSSFRYAFDLRFNYSLSTVYDDSRLDPSSDISNTRIWSFELGMGIALN